MPRRDVDETHRAATPLELLFDLVSVIAIAAAAAGLHHTVADAHSFEGIITFVCAFFGIWWAWMNYTWFASAYDNDDTLFRLLTIVIMAGSLTMAAGIGALFESLDLRLVVVGYVIMRVAMVALWLRAARHDAEGRITALWYAYGIALAQVYWVVVFLLNRPESASLFYGAFGLGMIMELTIPVIAENKGKTPWHRHHIIERYGLLNIIVLGETLLAGSIALNTAYGDHFEMDLLRIAFSSLVILFSLWWLYFSKEEHLETNELSRALIWGYGHLLIFISGAAVGAGFAVLVDIVIDHADATRIVGDFSVAIPVALYLTGLWFVRDRFALKARVRHVLLVFAILIVLAPLLPFALESIAVLTVLRVVVRNRWADAGETVRGS